MRAGRSLSKLTRAFEPTVATIPQWVKPTALDEGLRSDGLTTDERAELTRLNRYFESEFLSNVAHAIRTRMNAIVGGAELLQQTFLNEDQRRYLDVLGGNSDALVELVGDLLYLVKIESGRLTTEQAGFDLRELLARVADALSSRAQEKGVELSTQIDPGVPVKLLGDATWLRQILLNLAGSAIKYAEKEPVLLAVEPAKMPTSGSNVDGSAVLCFSITNTDTCIPSDKRESLLRSLAHLTSSTAYHYGGAGLGLAIATRLAEFYGGQLGVESGPAEGCRFTFVVGFRLGNVDELPPVTAGTHARNDAAVQHLDLTGIPVLVVDASAVNRMILREFLADSGAMVGEACTAKEALAEMKRAAGLGQSYRLVLLDYHTPGLNGPEIVEAMRQFYAGKDISLPSVVMLTSDELAAAVPGEAGIFTYLVRPIHRSELMDVIARAMSQPIFAPIRILLVDDSTFNRLLVREFVKGAPIMVEEAVDGRAGFERFKSGAFDLVLMDIQMPVMDGYLATKAIRAWELANRRAPTPIIALTASAFSDDVNQCLEAGCDTHVAKPIKRAHLLEALARFASRAVPNEGPAGGNLESPSSVGS